MLDAVIQDVRFALRLLRKSPLFTATAALSLAIGIGANTTIFSVANALLLRPLPGLAEPDRLVDIGRTDRGQGFDTVSYFYYRQVRERATTMKGVYACFLEPTAMSLGGRGEAERVYGSVVSGSFFPSLGTRPVYGRLLEDRDDVTVGGHPVTVISHELWERRFSSDPNIVGQSIVLSGTSFTVIGVTPRGFQGTTLMRSDLWVTLSMIVQAVPRETQRILTERGSVWLVMGGRLKDDVTIAQAQGELNTIASALEREYPDNFRGRGLSVLRAAVVPGQIGVVAAFLGLLMAIVGLVLLIACVNVSGMMLARAVARRREIAVRLAIGAGRSRLIRQLMTEAVIVFAAGGVMGLMLSRWLTGLLMAVLPDLPAPVFLDVTTDWRVLLFTIALSLVAAIVSGLVPALQASGSDLIPALKVDSSDTGPSKLRLRNVLVVGQVTMSLLLVVAAGLFLRALQRAANIPPGFDQTRVDVVSLDLSVAGFKDESGRQFVKQMLARISAMPGIESATAAVDLPLDGGRMGLGDLWLPGAQESAERGRIDADWNVVEPSFFRTLNIRLVRGRDFTDSDSSAAPRVMIVNESFARRAFPDRDPVGQRLLMEGRGEKREVTIVGIAADARVISLNGAVEPYVYVPLSQQYLSRVSLLVKTAGAASAIPQLRALIRDMNPNMPVSEALTLASVTAIGVIPQRIAASVAGTLGFVCLILTAIGIYGVTAYAVSRRTKEIGIRMALGADTSRVLRLVFRQGLVLAGIGVAIGVIVAGAGSTLLESLLFGVPGLDPLTFGGTCLLFAIVTLAATYVPARRATKVDPMIALRSE